MPTIRTTIDDATYAKLKAERQKVGLPSVSALFLQRCNVLDDSMEADEIVRQARSLAAKQPSKSRFRLRDLFKPAAWERFSKGARLRAGRLFFEKISAAKDGIRPVQKSASGHQFYVKA